MCSGSSAARTLFRISIPAIAGGLAAGLRNVADAYWAIPTPDWTLTIMSALLISLYAVHRMETIAGALQAVTDPGPGPLAQ